MKKSDTIGKIAVALCLAQKEIKGAIKDSSNPFFKSTYADLASVWEAIRKPLTDHGLSIAQLTDEHPEGVVIETILMHESGEWISGRLYMKPIKNDPQGIGSAITYGRRYGLQAITGVCPEDDDGNKASGRDGVEVKSITEAQAESLRKLITESSADLTRFLAAFGIATIGDLPISRFEEAKKRLEEKKKVKVKSAFEEARK